MSRLTFHYLNPLLALGSSRPLVEEDLWEPTPNNKATVICEPVKKSWNSQLQKESPSYGIPLFCPTLCISTNRRSGPITGSISIKLGLGIDISKQAMDMAADYFAVFNVNSTTITTNCFGNLYRLVLGSFK